MLAILVTHPIQYQVPLWQMLAGDGRVPFEVWYLTKHATERSVDREFGREFAWDLKMLEGYPHRFLRVPGGASPNTPWRCRITESFRELFQKANTKAVLVMGWQVAAYWQVVWAAKRCGVEVWLRGESNNLKERRKAEGGRRNYLMSPKRLARKLLLAQLFKRVDHFLCIGTANWELYRSYDVSESKLHMAMYAVDNDRFRQQAKAIGGQRSEIRSQWGIPEDAFCVLFCGKFIPKKRPMDIVEAAKLLLSENSRLQAPRPKLFKIHLLFAGSGELGAELRANCHVVFDPENPNSSLVTRHLSLPNASFTGFLNQTEVSRAYVAADILVLPSDYDETWGLVINEAMASGLPCVISDHCGCAADLGRLGSNKTFECADQADLAQSILEVLNTKSFTPCPSGLKETASVVEELSRRVTTPG